MKENFFDSDEIKLLESGENGLEYSSFLLKLYCKSLKQEGRLTLNDLVPYDAEMLATVTRCSVEFVEKALKKLKRLGLIEVLDDGVIYMLDIQNFIGKSSDVADRRRGYRARIDGEKEAKEQMSDKRRTNVTTNVGQMGNRDRDRDKERTRDISRDIDTDQIASRLNELIGHSEYTSEYISHIRKEDLPKFMEMVEQSDWLKENLNRYQEPDPQFIENVLKGKYITYGKSHNKVEKKPKQPKPGVANSQTSKYSGEDLNAMARRKFQEFQNKAHGGGNNDSI